MYKRRLKYLFAALAVIFGALGLRLFQLQVLSIKRDFAGQARSALYHREELAPVRGEIRARNGLALAYDRPRFDLAVRYPTLVSDDESWMAPTCAVTGKSPEELRLRAHAIIADVRRVREAVVRLHPRRYRVGNPTSPKYRPIQEEVDYHTLVTDLSFETVSRIEAQPDVFAGFRVQHVCDRLYPQGRLACHLLGHVSRLQREEVRNAVLADERPGRYRAGDPIGRNGVEREYDAWLRGAWGVRVKKDYVEQRTRQVALEVRPEQGDTLYLTIDPAAQIAAETALGERVGGAVLLDVHTGEVLALASAPGYDNNRYAAVLSDRDAPGRTLLDRSIQDPVRLGSVMKVAVALLGLEKGAITAGSRIECNGFIEIGGIRFGCTAQYGHGAIDVETALEHSCNVFFYKLGGRLGAEAIAPWARALGLGHDTGIDLPYEWAGRIPDPAWKQATGRGAWYPGDTCNLSIGEGNVQVTPAQVAVMMAAVANGGAVLRPHLLLKLVDGEDHIIRPAPSGDEVVARRLPINAGHLATVREGLRRVVFGGGGTARSVDGLRQVKAAGKTGSSEVVRNRLYHAWFVGYAPYDDPQVAFAVVIQRSPKHGGEEAGPVAARMLEAYFRSKATLPPVAALAGGEEAAP